MSTTTFTLSAYTGETLYARPQKGHATVWATGVVTITELLFNADLTGVFETGSLTAVAYNVYRQLGGSPAFTDGPPVAVLPAVQMTASFNPTLMPGETRTRLQTMIHYVGELGTAELAALEADGQTPYDLSGRTLRLVFDDESRVPIAQIEAGGLTVGGADNNVVSYTRPTAVTNIPRVGFFSLRDVVAGNVRLIGGNFEVLYSPDDGPA